MAGMRLERKHPGETQVGRGIGLEAPQLRDGPRLNIPNGRAADQMKSASAFPRPPSQSRNALARLELAHPQHDRTIAGDAEEPPAFLAQGRTRAISGRCAAGWEWCESGRALPATHGGRVPCGAHATTTSESRTPA